MPRSHRKIYSHSVTSATTIAMLESARAITTVLFPDGRQTIKINEIPNAAMHNAVFGFIDVNPGKTLMRSRMPYAQPMSTITPRAVTAAAIRPAGKRKSRGVPII
jgi:hypothetical protein